MLKLAYTHFKAKKDIASVLRYQHHWQSPIIFSQRVVPQEACQAHEQEYVPLSESDDTPQIS